MPAAPRVLADANVWLATVLDTHPHHGITIDWWQRRLLPRRGRICFCRMTELSLLRLLCNRVVMGQAVHHPRDARRVCDELLRQPAVAFLEEPAQLDARWRDLAPMATGRGGWTDSYLAAFALAGDLELVSLDAGFQRFPGLRLESPMV